MRVHIFLFIFVAIVKIANALRLTSSTLHSSRAYINHHNPFIHDNKHTNGKKNLRKFINRRRLVDESVKNNEHIIKLTDNAKNKIMQLVSEGKNGENLILRLSVQNGGCKGLQYKLNPIKKDEIEADDYVQQFDELKFILSIDATSVIYIYNNILDYSSDLINGGFKFINPNATKKCGCGKSFNV
ncbi:iron-sulfur assembly protein, putative [Plasmodium ovale]|uniref:Iron-sulfur assembly protein, putative n=1 Tax=Plasmodium ovale TaxID=36330 RepID=A0A1C3KTJ0_PLAOA|nr:iron-sulfur assembly protein, putative [Plasmodium ovale]